MPWAFFFYKHVWNGVGVDVHYLATMQVIVVNCQRIFNISLFLDELLDNRGLRNVFVIRSPIFNTAVEDIADSCQNRPAFC